jgi:hypothetical protein
MLAFEAAVCLLITCGSMGVFYLLLCAGGGRERQEGYRQGYADGLRAAFGYDSRGVSPEAGKRGAELREALSDASAVDTQYSAR